LAGYRVAGKLILAALSGEVVLKSPRTRPRFETRLLQNIARALARWGAACNAGISEARILVYCREEAELEKAMDALLHVFGVHAAAIAYKVEFSTLEDLASAVEEVAASWVRGKTFAVRARRSGREPFTSLDVARIVGAKLKPYSAGVNLSNPQVEVHVEVRGSIAYIHKGMVRGAGGLPIGVEGRALVLFSGGLDSPVAAWFAAKRGIEVDFLHFILASPQSARDAERVARKLASLWLHAYTPKLILSDFRPVTAVIASNVRKGYEQVVLRVAMYYAADIIASKIGGYDALVTGESIGQVSSQTLKNIAAIESTYKPRLPLLRPLAGMDKEEIVGKCRGIGVYDEASKTKEYCRLARGPAVTRADPRVVEEEFSKIRSTVEEAALNFTIKSLD